MGDVVAINGLGRDLEQYLRGDTAAPTPERIAKAVLRGEDVVVRGTGREAKWRISPTLDSLLKRETITREEYDAATRFLSDYYQGMYAGPPTSGYRERTVGGARADRDTQRAHHAIEARKAMAAVPQMLKPALVWLIACLGEASPLSVLGAHYVPHLGTQTQSSRGGQVLSFLCVALCEHYGMTHRLQNQKLADELAQLLGVQFGNQISG
jgi:hypothetical protein